MHINAYIGSLPCSLWRGYANCLSDWPELVRRVAYKGTEEWLLRSYRPKVIHETYYAWTGRGPAAVRRVLTIHDMIHEKFAGAFKELRGDVAARKRQAALRADHLIFISEATRRDALELLDIDAAHTSVVHLGFDLMLLDPAVDDWAPPAGRRYILHVGLRGGYKNFSTLARAYASSRTLRADFRLVCFGGGVLTSGEVAMLKGFGLSERDVECVQGNDQLLRHLYRHAAVFVYPSLYEGFGIPPLEAMAHDCPVACSNTSSIPEVVGDAGEYFNPSDSDSIRAALETVLSNPTMRAERVRLGRLRLGAFSWDRCAAETAAVYRVVTAS